MTEAQIHEVIRNAPEGYYLGGDRIPEVSVVIPYYRAGFIGWVALESLVRQIDVDFDWELIIIQESFDNPFEGFDEYWPKLKKVGCCRLTYQSIDQWIPLSAKWWWLFGIARGNYLFCNAADIYMAPHRLKRQHDILKDGKFNWFKIPGNIVYDIGSGKHVKLENMDPQRPDTCCRAFSTDLVDQLPLVNVARGVDSWTMRNIKGPIKCFYDKLDPCELSKQTVNIRGLSNFPAMKNETKSERVINISPPLQWCCGSIEAHVPADIAKRLKEARRHIIEHEELLKERVL